MIDRMPATDVILLKGTKEFQNSIPHSYAVEALEDLVWTLTDTFEACLSYSLDDHCFKLLRVFPIRDSVEVFATCTHFLHESQASRNVGFTLDLADGWRCDQCWVTENVLLRNVCPSHCGCDHPRSSQFLKSAVLGCPEMACRSSDTNRVALDVINCTNPGVADLQWNENWTQILRNVQNHAESLGFDLSAWTGDLWSLGCSALRDFPHFLLHQDLSLVLW